MLQSSWPASLSLGGLTLLPNLLERWLATLEYAINPGSNTSGLLQQHTDELVQERRNPSALAM